MRTNRQQGKGDMATEGDEFKRELMTTEHIPYALIIFNAIEEVRKGIVHHEDAGVGALLGLHTVLPAKIRKQLPGLVDEILKYSRLRITYRKVLRKKRQYRPPIYGTEEHQDPSGLWHDERVQNTKGGSVLVTVASHKLDKEYQTTRSAQREFVYTTLMRIIDILDAEGILWRSRMELIGGEL